METITKQTWDTLKEKGIDPVWLTKSPNYDVTHEEVISYLRETFGIIIDVRFSNKNIMWPPYYSLIFKENQAKFCRRVPQKCNEYGEMAEFAIQEAINLLPKGNMKNGKGFVDQKYKKDV